MFRVRIYSIILHHTKHKSKYFPSDRLPNFLNAFCTKTLLLQRKASSLYSYPSDYTGNGKTREEAVPGVIASPVISPDKLAPLAASTHNCYYVRLKKNSFGAPTTGRAANPFVCVDSTCGQTFRWFRNHCPCHYCPPRNDYFAMESSPIPKFAGMGAALRKNI